jgi:aromatic ring-opening dioxygenase catalytic subunit (LigB family)
MVATLERIAEEIGRPSAILVISAHWEAEAPTITALGNPGLIYDYYGFPPESYELEYPCPGSPRLAGRVRDILTRTGMDARLDERRGIDHGAFVPLKIMYPQADIPCVQLSLLNSLDPGRHLSMGNALASLDEPGLLVLGSGFSFHNMEAFFQPESAQSHAWNEAFQEWLADTCAHPGISEGERTRRLNNWQSAPHARYCHPREEHLLPLHVCAGMAGKPTDADWRVRIMNRNSRMFHWSMR